MDPRGEFAHAIRNPLAAVDANLRFVRELCRDLERQIARPDDAAGSPPELLREARAALDDSVAAVEQIRTRLRDLVGERR